MGGTVCGRGTRVLKCFVPRPCAVAAPDRVKEVALALKAMYDEDLAEDEIIVAWGGKEDAAKGLGVKAAAAAAVRKAAAPIIEWLQEEEDEEDDE